MTLMNGITSATHWRLNFLLPDVASADGHNQQASLSSTTTASYATHRALIILNQSFSHPLLDICWRTCQWRCCADGGANRLHDLLASTGDGRDERSVYVPDLIKGDFDSLRDDVRAYYENLGVPVVQDFDQDSTDLMKCVDSAREWEASLESEQRTDFIILGGLSGRLDHTIHTLSYVHKLRRDNRRVFVITDDNISWVLKEGEHIIHVDRLALGPSCGMLPVGIDSTMLTTEGLKWNLTNHPSSFDGMVSTSNAVVSSEVRIVTTKPIWWCIELASGLL